MSKTFRPDLKCLGFFDLKSLEKWVLEIISDEHEVSSAKPWNYCVGESAFIRCFAGGIQFVVISE